MQWIAPLKKDIATDTLEKRLWVAVDLCDIPIKTSQLAWSPAKFVAKVCGTLEPMFEHALGHSPRILLRDSRQLRHSLQIRRVGVRLGG